VRMAGEQTKSQMNQQKRKQRNFNLIRPPRRKVYPSSFGSKYPLILAKAARSSPGGMGRTGAAIGLEVYARNLMCITGEHFGRMLHRNNAGRRFLPYLES
jgi:hypothetical protein